MFECASTASLDNARLVMVGKVEGYDYAAAAAKVAERIATPTVVRGDANGDGEIGMPDVMFVVNYILGDPAETFNAENADANLDGEIGMPDVMFIVQYILNGKFPDQE
jgi:predicted RNA-binding protein